MAAWLKEVTHLLTDMVTNLVTNLAGAGEQQGSLAGGGHSSSGVAHGCPRII